MIKNTIALVDSNFTTGRMMQDYMDRYYLPQIERSEVLSVTIIKKPGDGSVETEDC